MAETESTPKNTNKRKVFRPLRAIREHCVHCAGGSVKEVRMCPVKDCTLWPYRFGKRPATAAKHDAKRLAKQEIGNDGDNPRAGHQEER